MSKNVVEQKRIKNFIVEKYCVKKFKFIIWYFKTIFSKNAKYIVNTIIILPLANYHLYHSFYKLIGKIVS